VNAFIPQVSAPHEPLVPLGTGLLTLGTVGKIRRGGAWSVRQYCLTAVACPLRVRGLLPDRQEAAQRVLGRPQSDGQVRRPQMARHHHVLASPWAVP
jgi:hypothetical protein